MQKITLFVLFAGLALANAGFLSFRNTTYKQSNNTEPTFNYVHMGGFQMNTGNNTGNFSDIYNNIADLVNRTYGSNSSTYVQLNYTNSTTSIVNTYVNDNSTNSSYPSGEVAGNIIHQIADQIDQYFGNYTFNHSSFENRSLPYYARAADHEYFFNGSNNTNGTFNYSDLYKNWPINARFADNRYFFNGSNHTNGTFNYSDLYKDWPINARFANNRYFMNNNTNHTNHTNHTEPTFDYVHIGGFEMTISNFTNHTFNGSDLYWPVHADNRFFFNGSNHTNGTFNYSDLYKNWPINARFADNRYFSNHTNQTNNTEPTFNYVHMGGFEMTTGNNTGNFSDIYNNIADLVNRTYDSNSTYMQMNYTNSTDSYVNTYVNDNSTTNSSVPRGSTAGNIIKRIGDKIDEIFGH